MDIGHLTHIFTELNQPAYRLAQAKRSLYIEFLGGWEEVTPFSKNLRETLRERVPWSSIEPVKVLESKSGDTIKTLFAARDDKRIEAVLMRHAGGRNTVCVSSQAGCAMKCAFCATGTLGFTRNLSAEEIVDQVLHFARYLKPREAHITNVVFMGMGEPLHNYEEMMVAIRILNDQGGFMLGARHITVSTCGIVPGIRKLAKEALQVNLAVSLHSAVDKTRDRLMPVNKAYPLAKLMGAVEEYAERTNRKVFFEYLLIKGVNDTPREAEALVELMSRDRRLYHVNLIKYHATGAFEATPTVGRQVFMDRLQRAGISATFRISFGEDIAAACGQLAGKVEPVAP